MSRTSGVKPATIPLYRSDCEKDAKKGTWRKKMAEAARVVAQDMTPALCAAAPGAKVVIVGYLRLLPKSYDDAVNCGWLG